MKVSVIVPIYGVEAYIGLCAQTLLSQTYPDIEFLFVNDGTPDRSMEILRDILRQFPARQVKVLNLENRGQALARVAGLEEASGDYVWFVDADDWVEPDAVERMVDKAQQTRADIVYFDFWKEWPGRRKLDRERPYTAASRDKYMRRLFRDGAYGYLWNKFIRKSLFKGLFFPRYNMHEDVVLVTQLLSKAKVLAQLSVPLVHYRRGNAGAATKAPKLRRRGAMARNYLDMYEFYRNLPGPNLLDTVQDDLMLRAAWVGYTLDRSLFY